MGITKEQLNKYYSIRPMHLDENWDRTIEHEQGSNKTYYVLDDIEGFEDFLAD